jgi:dTDP-glucose pyrophosphorylase
MQIIIPMAGVGSRFSNAGYSLPKPLIDVNGEPMVSCAISSLGIPDGKLFCLIRKDQFSNDVRSAILQVAPSATIVEIDYVTAGAAASTLLMTPFIDPDDEVIVANCDQVMKWDSHKIIAALREFDGGVATFENTDPKHSYLEVIGGRIVRFVEKKVISNIALTGIHYWKKASYLIDSANEMIAKNDRSANGEFYISTTYNYMIPKYNVGHVQVTESEFFPIGTPADLNKYLYESKQIK